MVKNVDKNLEIIECKERELKLNGKRQKVNMM
jgi:hypothetical protein